MRLLVTGSGRSGSWQVRGEQLGRAIGARVVARATEAEIRRADVVVLVKRAPVEMLAALARHPRVVWDVVDAWPQPRGVRLSEADAKAWLAGELRRVAPVAVVWPTQRMQADAGWQGPQTVVRHHGWNRYRPREIDGPIRVVGYEGAAHYLGRWHEALARACAARGWQFQVNGDMQQADIGVALRDGACYAATHWKSNCKLANLQRLGIPAICSMESGYLETASGAETWITRRSQIDPALDALSDPDTREQRAQAMRACDIPLEVVAADYRRWLDAL